MTTQPAHPQIERIDRAAALAEHRFRYYDLLLAATCVIVVCSNVIGPGKAARLTIPGTDWPITFGAGILFFPLAYVLGDVLTEVYGYARARRAIWASFAAAAFASASAAFIVWIPADPKWDVDAGGMTNQAILASIFGQTPRIFAASCLAIWAGEFTNALVLAKMKVRSSGKHLWQRTIGSTIAGQAVDSLVFYPVAFLGVWSNELLLIVMTTNYLMKVAWEAILTPVTYRVVAVLKRVEGVDVYDVDTRLTPFTAKLDS